MNPGPEALTNAKPASAAPLTEKLSWLGLPQWQPNRLMQPRPWLQATGIGALFVFGFFGISLDSIPEKAATLANLCGLAMLAIYGKPVDGVSLRRSPIMWLAVAAIGVALVSWMASWISHPQWAESSFKVHRLTAWFAMIPVAVILGGQARNAHILWTVALAGLLISPWISGGGLHEWQQGFTGERIDFGLHNAQHTAMLFGTAALGLLAFAPAILRKRQCAWPLRLGWLLALAVSVTAVILTQTRGVWAGFLVALLVLIVASGITLNKHVKRHRSYIAVGITATVASAILSGYLSLGDIISQRLEAEQETLTLVQQGDLESVPYTSMGIRLHTWVEAGHWIAQHPLVGWGGNGRSLIFEHSEALPQEIKQSFGHLHNSYLDLLVGFGLLGLLLLAAMVYWLTSRSIRYYRSGLLSGRDLTFALSFTVFFGIINCFESYLFFDSGKLALAIVGGGLLTQLWAAKRQLAAKAAANQQAG